MTYKKNNREIEFKTILEDKKNATTFRHFKGHLVKIITIAKNTETLEEEVIYLHDQEVWARPIDMFFSLVDKNKYKDIEQEYRFEKMK